MIDIELISGLPCLTAEEGVVTELNPFFVDFTGYVENEIIGRSVSDVFKILRMSHEFDLNNPSTEVYYYIFTKEHDYRNIKVNAEQMSSSCVKYIFSEKPNSRFEDKHTGMNKLLTDGHFGIGVYSLPDLTLINANQAYLNLFDEPLNRKESAIGLYINNLVDWSKLGKAKETFMNVISSGNTFYGKEIKGITGNWKSNYYDNTIIPVSEDGEVRYVISMVEDVTERVINRQKVEEQAKLLEKQNKELEAIIENMSDGLFIIDANGRFTFLNEGAKEFFYNVDYLENAGDELIHTIYYDIDGNVIPLEQMPGHRILRGEIIRSSRVTAVRPDGTFHFAFSGCPIYDENGKVQKAVLCSRNVTKIAENENLIKFKNKQFQLVIDNISEEMCVFDKDRNYILFNKASRERQSKIGMNSLNDTVEKYGYSDISGNKIDVEDLPFSKVMRGETVREYISMVNDPDKRYVCTNGTPILDDNGNFIMGILSRRDVTSDILYKQAIESQLDILYQIIHNLDLPLLRVSYPDLIVLDINQKAFKTMQLMNPGIRSANQIKGSKFENLMPDFYKGNSYKYINEAATEKKTRYRKDVIQIANGEEQYYNIIFEPLLGADGEVEEIIMISVDVTSEVQANKAMEKMLTQQEEFFTNISHELKTPLNVIYATVQLFNMYCKEGSLDEKRESITKYIGSITQNCYRLSRLINNIVDLSKIEAGFYELNISNHNIVNVVEEIVMSVVSYTEVKGLNIIFDTDVEEKIIACDPEKIERVILNLISNAIKFSNAGDEISVCISDRDDYVEVSVKDNGTGIDKSHLGKIFERFKQVDKSLSRNAEGSGIGLSLVKSIVELHGGEISVDSDFGKGSKFTVLLPAGEVKEMKNTFNSNLMKNNKQMVSIELSDI